MRAGGGGGGGRAGLITRLSGVACGRQMQWYSSPNVATITTGAYRLHPSNTTGVRSAALMASKSGVRNSFHSVTMASVADCGVDHPLIACIWQVG